MKFERQLDPATMAMQYWANMAQAWFGAMAPFMSGMPGMPGRNWDYGGSAPPPPFQTHAAGGRRFAVAVQVSSAHPTEVRVSLADDRSAQKPLRVVDLESDHGHKLPASGIRFEAGRHEAGEHLRVHVEVPEGTPAGTYAGPIMDAERNGVGKLEVVIHRR